jgi:hypothetical protein
MSVILRRWWDGPLFCVRAEGFEARFALGSAAEVDSVENVDVFVQLADGSKWTATVFTLAEVRRLMDRWAVSGEARAGAYFWCWDGLIVRDAGVAPVVEVLAGLVASGEVRRVLRSAAEETVV